MHLLSLLPVFASALLHGDVTFDERSLMIGGDRELFLGGAVHYPRVRPADWDRVFKLAKGMGLNTIQTYVFWNVHEPHLADRGNATWSGWADLPAFIRKAEEYDMYIALRIGPYVCGEYYFGGFPVWLRDFGGIQCFRCADPVFEAEMQRWVSDVVELVRPMLQPRGNIMMLQIENEYQPSGDQNYLNWAVDMAAGLTTNEAVPWNMCHSYSTCVAANNRNGTYDYRVLCTMNGFWMDEYQTDTNQPCPKWIEDLRTQQPGQPTMWTEDQGWFDLWGKAKRIRKSNDQLYGIARWMAYGGSYHSFYMVTGGNNYGLKAGRSVTAYAPDAAISPMLLKHQPRYDYFQKFFETLIDYKDALLSSPIAKTQLVPIVNGSSVNGTTTATILPCTDTDPSHPGSLDASQRWNLQDGMLRVDFTGTPLCLDALLSTKAPALVPCDASAQSQQWSWNFTSQTISSVAEGPCQVPESKGKMCRRCLDTGASATALALWDCAGHTPEYQIWAEDGEQGFRPQGKSDSCLSGTSAGGGTIELHEYGRLAFLSNSAAEALEAMYQGQTYSLPGQSVALIDVPSGRVLMHTGDATDPEDQEHVQTGASKATTWQVFQETPGYGANRRDGEAQPHEQLNLTQNDVDYMWYSAAVPAGTAASDIAASAVSGGLAYPFVVEDRVHVLSVAMGFSNDVDSMPGSGAGGAKGIADVRLMGQPLAGPWNHSWLLEGEAKAIFEPESTDTVSWESFASEHLEAPILWLKASFDLPGAADLSDEQVSFALDLSTMWKGIAYVNGFNLGRYWLRSGECSGTCAPPIKNGHCYMHWKDCDKPTQSLYHVPSDVLKASGNLVLLFEEAKPETPRKPSGVRLVSLAAQESQDLPTFV